MPGQWRGSKRRNTLPIQLGQRDSTAHLDRDGGRCTWLTDLHDGGPNAYLADDYDPDTRCTSPGPDVDHIGDPDDRWDEMVVEGGATRAVFQWLILRDPAYVGNGKSVSVHTRWIETEFDNRIECLTASEDLPESGERHTVVVEVGGHRRGRVGCGTRQRSGRPLVPLDDEAIQFAHHTIPARRATSPMQWQLVGKMGEHVWSGADQRYQCCGPVADSKDLGDQLLRSFWFGLLSEDGEESGSLCRGGDRGGEGFGAASTAVDRDGLQEVCRRTCSCGDIGDGGDECF